MDKRDILKQLTILYLEDDDDVRINISETLSCFVKKVYSTTNPIEALELYNNRNINIIISDIDIPQMSGIEFIKEIRNQNINIPIVILTAYKTEEYLLESIPLHLEKYLVKPISYEELKDTLINCVERLDDLQMIDIMFENNITYSYYNKTLIDTTNNSIKLPFKERLLLDLLIENKNKLTFYEEIEQVVWEGNPLNKLSLKTIINNLRKKIGAKHIINHSEIGYRLVI